MLDYIKQAVALQPLFYTKKQIAVKFYSPSSRTKPKNKIDTATMAVSILFIMGAEVHAAAEFMQ